MAENATYTKKGSFDMKALWWKLQFLYWLYKAVGFRIARICFWSELENWFDESEEWKHYDPKWAVAENMSYWGD